MDFTIRASTVKQSLAVLSCLLVCSSGCFIRNCPMGGKRSMDSIPDVTTRECLRCGPDDLGQCVGPNICCGAAIGCFINTDESAACERENKIPAPCEVDGEPCSSVPGGRCATNGVCCSDEKCQLDSQCEIGGKRSYRKNGMTPDILKYLRHLVDHRAYPNRR